VDQFGPEIGDARRCHGAGRSGFGQICEWNRDCGGDEHDFWSDMKDFR